MKVLILVGVMGAAATGAASADTLEDVRNRGFVSCGVTERMPGFSILGQDGVWSGFNVDLCRALAAATLKDAAAIQVGDFWLDALLGGDADVLYAGSTWTLSRDTEKAVDFTDPVFYDGQGFLVKSIVGAKTLKQAMAQDNVEICAISETSTAEGNIRAFVAANDLTWKVVPVQTMDGMWRAFFGGRCNMAIHDRSALATVYADRLEGSDNFIVYPDVISKEPLAPAVRDNDREWVDIVRWVTLVMIAAEEHGVTSANVDDMRANSSDWEVRRLLGVEPGLGEGLGLDDAWAYRIIKSVGNYGEMFERNLGSGSKFKLSRGLNATWKDGGLLIAPPLR